MLAEEYKFKEDRSSPYKVMDCKQADILITDNKLDPQYRKYFKKNIKIREVLEEEKNDKTNFPRLIKIIRTR